ERLIDFDPAPPLRVCFDELPYGLVPVQTAQVLEGLPGEDERVPEVTFVRRHGGPGPFPAPFGEHAVYNSRSHARLIAQEQHDSLTVLARRVHPGEQRGGAARAVGGV